MFSRMFMVTESDAAAIRAAYDTDGELSAEARRLGPQPSALEGSAGGGIGRGEPFG